MFGISNNVRSRVVRVCTPELFHQVTRSPLVGRICAEIADALEAMRRGEMAPEDFDILLLLANPQRKFHRIVPCVRTQEAAG